MRVLRLRSPLATFAQDDSFSGAQIFFGVDTNGVAGCAGDVDGNAVVEKAELLETLDALQPGRRKGGESIEGRFPIGVDAEVLAIAGKTAIPIEGDGGAGKVEGAVVVGSNNFDGVGIVDVGSGAADGEGCDLNLGALEELQQGHEVLRGEERLVSLNIDVNVSGDRLGDGVNAIGAAGAILGGEDGGQAVGLGEVEDLVGVGGNEDLVEQRAGTGGAVNPDEHGLAGDFAEDFAGQARGAETRGDDGENVAEVRGQRQILRG
jgi:hypothetical protein